MAMQVHGAAEARWLELLGLSGAQTSEPEQAGVGALMRSLQDNSDTDARCQAASALGSLGHFAGRAGAVVLAQALRRDRSAAVRCSAAEALGELAAPWVAEVCGDALAQAAAADSDAEVRWAALRALQEVGSTTSGPAAEALTQRMIQESRSGARIGAVSSVSASAALALGVLGPDVGEVGALGFAKTLLGFQDYSDITSVAGKSGDEDAIAAHRHARQSAAGWLLGGGETCGSRRASAEWSLGVALSKKFCRGHDGTIHCVLQRSVETDEARHCMEDREEVAAHQGPMTMHTNRDDELLSTLLEEPIEEFQVQADRDVELINMLLNQPDSDLQEVEGNDECQIARDVRAIEELLAESH
mmetsp:Transcript_40620/g.103360  ORF Transcript_40620/g.103360 Transcript_40620/m.103360 type:complete len:359 (-) Transcript_40620:32-1108(-)|eukprot:CAMPEP_0183391004 /NCGR_PEP_ID=MMETSP0370-20130417/6158_1 /TAXON_ID=268820 /ORGANISM="Peridinium aciculiferum, Strain PAER-2" /LENGTH=358 /DNA_ID=CAMNT_0025570651 /DNA_START=50 /DNA_END=1126 /DNA_ORIENTATION=-